MEARKLAVIFSSKTMPEAKALDLSHYLPHSPAQSANRFSHDLASLSIEAESNSEKKLFITPFTYQVDLQGQTVTSNSYAPGVDIRKLFLSSPEVIALANHSLNINNYEAGRFGYIWISGPEEARPGDGFHGYSDSRLGVGVANLTSTAGTTAVLENYSGLNPNLSQADCLDLAFYASNFSPDGPRKFTSVRQLRDTPIFVHIPADQDPLEHILINVLHRPDLYAQISSGQAHQLYNERLSFARQVAPTVAVGLLGARSEMDFIRIGAFAERTMMNLSGIVIDGRGSGCGALNSQLLLANYFGTGYSPNRSEVTYSCPEISCPMPSCHWKPSSNELRSIESGSLTCCPDCGYNPSTRTRNVEVYSRPTIAGEQSLPIQTVTTPVSYSETDVYKFNPTSSKDTPADCPWAVYFFTPWLDPNWVTSHSQV